MNSNDRANLIKRVNTLEGLTDKERSALLGLLREKKTYGLVWEDKPEVVEERLRDELPILTEVPERAIISEDKDAPNHILIEGDNLEALATLAYTHEGKIDIIYIDPPYNTGNNDFIYNDSYVDKEDSYRHSKWLSFMSRRLRIAKKLLSDYGVIFISIDDNEQADLKILCDSIFMPSNFCGQFIWRKKSGGGQTDRYFVTEHEYILVYQATNKFCWKDIQIEKSRKNYKCQDEKGSYNLIKLEKWGSSAHKEDRPSMYFPIKNPDGEDIPRRRARQGHTESDTAQLPRASHQARRPQRPVRLQQEGRAAHGRRLRQVRQGDSRALHGRAARLLREKDTHGSFRDSQRLARI